MIITWKQNLKHLSYDQFHHLRRLSHLSKSIYNQALFNLKNQYHSSHDFLRYESNWRLLKDHENYKLLGGGIAQQSIKSATWAFQSFFGLLKLQKKGEYQSWKIREPHFLPKDGYHPLKFTQPLYLKNGIFTVPVSRVLKKETTIEIKIIVPEALRNKNLKEIHIVPKHHGEMFEARFVVDLPDVDPLPDLDYSKALAIDLGINNFATCASSEGDSFIIDGRKIKSINQGYFKEMARLQSIKDKQNFNCHKWTRLMYTKCEKRKRQVDDIVYCSAKKIVDYCIKHDIGNIVVGYNEGFQDSPHLGHKTNQTFCFMPYGRLKDRLEFLCKKYGINYQTQEESYTSKASFWDKDEIPVWVPNKPRQGDFSGKRIHRGMYQRFNGQKLNADVNAALNILRKSNVVSLDALYARGEVIAPLRIRLA